MSYFLYILCCADSTYYIGSTTDVARRLREHNTTKQGAKYTRMRRPVTLQYVEEHESLSAVLKREHALKQLTRRQKESLWLK